MSRVLAVCVALCVIVVLMHHVNADCRRGNLIESYCVYDGVRYEPGEKWRDNTYTNSCNECSCSKNGWSCCS